MKAIRTAATAAALLLVCAPSFAAKEKPIKAYAPMCDSLTAYLSHYAHIEKEIFVCGESVSSGKLNLTFSLALSEYPLRSKTIADIYDIVEDNLPEKQAKYAGNVNIFTDGQKIERLKSHFYSSDLDNADVKTHIKLAGNKHDALEAPLVIGQSRHFAAEKGLAGRHIALWQSHGYYYEPSLTRWEWQRGRLMETVEDLYTQSYVTPFLAPMLENAGAYVLMPRERDWNTTELLVDYDMPGSGYNESGIWHDARTEGFAHLQRIYLNGDNPFKAGGVRMVKGAADENDIATASWTPDFPKGGEYAVYVSYSTIPSSTTSAKYEVRHNGGSTIFSVNQKMGGGTWIYLGTFSFSKGSGGGQGVYLSNESSNPQDLVTADAVKFGGGTGNIARSPLEPEFSMHPETSGYPRAAEASRYWLQWAGFNDTIYSPTNFANDYKDDYQCRGKWVNTLCDGSYVRPDRKGYNIPVDLSFAFHTDAGIAKGDSTIGTLAIYTRVARGRKTFANGEKRDIAREYADIVQTQIVSDILEHFDENWSRRGLRDKAYSECSTQEVPSMLLEFLSHQNFTDMRFGLDPEFRFVVSRAIYKGMLKYLAYINGKDYVVQPLPVNSFSVTLEESECDSKHVVLRWLPTEDLSEKSADPDSYIVYTRLNDGGFDNGTPVEGCCYETDIEPGEMLSFKITAVNAGGQSFPSEILCAGLSTDSLHRGKALVVNNFDRISAPASFAAPDSSFAGFLDKLDGGVPYINDISYCGPQFDFRCKSSWKDDDNAGFGASYGNYETMVIAGNTFDFPSIHGKALMAAGYDFCSTSRDAYVAGATDSIEFAVLDVICGKQVTTLKGYKGPLRYSIFPEGLRKRISDYASAGGNIILSGANIASDLWDKTYQYETDSDLLADYLIPARQFAGDILKIKWRSNQATATGNVRTVQNRFMMKAGKRYDFHIKPNTELYHVESPDAIEPADNGGAATIMRYSDNNLSAGVAYIGKDYRCVALGFPIETLTSQGQIDDLMASILELFK